MEVKGTDRFATLRFTAGTEGVMLREGKPFPTKDEEEANKSKNPHTPVLMRLKR